MASALEVTRSTWSLDVLKTNPAWWFKQEKHEKFEGFGIKHGGLTNNDINDNNDNNNNDNNDNNNNNKNNKNDKNENRKV